MTFMMPTTRDVDDALDRVDRCLFAPAGLEGRSGTDAALPIGYGQTLPRRQVVSQLCEALMIRPADRVLEIGTGSGYTAAVLSLLAGHVDSVERIAPLARLAANRIRFWGFRNVAVHVGDGATGWPSGAPFDRIVVTACATAVPAALLAQLTAYGLLVIPVFKQDGRQIILRIWANGRLGFATEELAEASFVPMIQGQCLSDAAGDLSD